MFCHDILNAYARKPEYRAGGDGFIAADSILHDKRGKIDRISRDVERGELARTGTVFCETVSDALLNEPDMV